MSVIKIDYSEIKSAGKKAEKVSKLFDSYADEIDKKIIKKIDSLEGTDERGHVSAARSIVSKKVKELRGKTDYYKNLSTNLEKLADKFESKEEKVVANVREVATAAFDLENQSVWKGIAQWAYGTFCVDLVNWNPISRTIANYTKSGLDFIQKKGTKLVDWFKHGEGKYVLEIIFDIGTVVTSIIGTVGAIAVAIGTGGAATPLVVAAIASTVATVMTVVNKGVSIYNKVKGYKEHTKSNDPGKARFFGNINGVNDKIKRTDFGDASDNKIMGGLGNAYDFLHAGAEITSIVSGAWGKAGLVGVRKKTSDGRAFLETIYDPTKVKGNLKNIFKESIGLRNKNGKWTFEAKSFIGIKERKTGYGVKADILEKDLITDVLNGKVWKRMQTINKITSTPSKINDAVDSLDKFNKLTSEEGSAYDKSKIVLESISDSKMSISTPAGYFNDTVVKVVDLTIQYSS